MSDVLAFAVGRDLMVEANDGRNLLPITGVTSAGSRYLISQNWLRAMQLYIHRALSEQVSLEAANAVQSAEQKYDILHKLNIEYNRKEHQ